MKGFWEARTLMYFFSIEFCCNEIIDPELDKFAVSFKTF